MNPNNMNNINNTNNKTQNSTDLNLNQPDLNRNLNLNLNNIDAKQNENLVNLNIPNRHSIKANTFVPQTQNQLHLNNQMQQIAPHTHQMNPALVQPMVPTTNAHNLYQPFLPSFIPSYMNPQQMMVPQPQVQPQPQNAYAPNSHTQTQSLTQNAAAMGKPSRDSGKVKWFNSQKGYGFIAPHDGTGDIFVHHSECHCSGYRSLAVGEFVEYEIDTIDGKRKARHVTGPNGAFCIGSQPHRRNQSWPHGRGRGRGRGRGDRPRFSPMAYGARGGGRGGHGGRGRGFGDGSGSGRGHFNKPPRAFNEFKPMALPMQPTSNFNMSSNYNSNSNFNPHFGSGAGAGAGGALNRNLNHHNF